jgi:hypothetical protein
MPFELGIAYSLSRLRPHSFFVFEEKAFRLQTSLSDLGGYDPYIHDGSPSGVLRCVLDCFGVPSEAPRLPVLETLARRLTQTALRFQKEQRASGLFHPYLFRRIGLAAIELAKHRGLIE